MNLPSLSILIATIGRETLIDMLNSLADQLDERDNVYLAIDGREHFEDVERILKEFGEPRFNLNVIYEEEKLGFWGVGIRNKHQKNLKGDYILHGDDDDIYLEGSMDMIKQIMSVIEPETLMFFRFYLNQANNHSVWTIPSLQINNIGTPSGVIPNVPSKMGEWGYRYGGDFDFYNSCKFAYKFANYHIYAIKPRMNGTLIN